MKHAPFFGFRCFPGESTGTRSGVSCLIVSGTIPRSDDGESCRPDDAVCVGWPFHETVLVELDPAPQEATSGEAESSGEQELLDMVTPGNPDASSPRS